MEKLQRVFKPMFEEMLEKGLLTHRDYKVVNPIKLEMLLDALDARFMAYGGASAEDLAGMILQGLGVSVEDPGILEAYVIGFRGGQVATESGAERMDLSCNRMEYSAVGEYEEAEE